MKFKKKETILTVVVVLLCGFVVFALFRGSSGDENFPDGTWWVCTNPAGKHEFNLSIKEVSDHHAKNYGQPIKCPKCGSEAVRATKCGNCGTVAAQKLDVVKCPSCGKAYEETMAAED